MSDFSKYFLMTTEDVPKYVQSKLTYFSKDAKLSCTEIGDGNINYVFRVQDKNGKSIIVKQAGLETRIKPDLGVSTDRGKNRIGNSFYTEFLCQRPCSQNISLRRNNVRNDNAGYDRPHNDAYRSFKS